MGLTCEVCGRPLEGASSKVTIDGAVLMVCPRCAGRGRPYRPPPSLRSRLSPRPSRRPRAPELEVDPRSGAMVKQARERRGMTQEQLGRAINVKASVISLVESGKVRPDLVLAGTLSRYLKVELLVPGGELES